MSRVGIDLVTVAAVTQSIAQFGQRYLHRIYTAQELADCGGEQSPSPMRLAARFAAKEAALKVLRPHQHWYDWRHIEIKRSQGGWVELQLHGAAALQAAQQGLQSFSVSLSHEREYAVAVVIGTA